MPPDQRISRGQFTLDTYRSNSVIVATIDKFGNGILANKEKEYGLNHDPL
jgi:hypothetical protein